MKKLSIWDAMSSKKSDKFISINGAYGEGGGQLTRVAIGLSAITGKPISIDQVRGSRSGGGGLKAQHLDILEFLARASRAKVTGGSLFSGTLKFEPGVEASSRWWELDTLGDGSYIRSVVIKQQTAEPISLVLQAVLPFLLYSSVAPDASAPPRILLTIFGGTHVSSSPSLAYVEFVLIPNLRICGVPHIRLLRDSKQCWTDLCCGLPDSPGRASFLINPIQHGACLNDFSQKIREPRGQIGRFTVFFIESTSLHEELFEAIEYEVITRRSEFSHYYPDCTVRDLFDVEFFVERVDMQRSSCRKRVYILLVAETKSGWRLGKDLLWQGGKKDKKPEPKVLAEQIVNDFFDDLYITFKSQDGIWTGLDDHMMDQLAIFQALAAPRTGNGPGEGQANTMGINEAETLSGGLGGAALNRNHIDPSVGTNELRPFSGHSRHTFTSRKMCEKILGVKFDEPGFCDGVGLVSGTVDKSGDDINVSYPDQTLDDNSSDSCQAC